MTSRILQYFGVASILGTGVLLAASPAKAISYSFTSAGGQFACDSTSGFSGTCSLSFNNFTADWNGSAWTFDQPSVTNTVTISNGSDSFSLNTAFPNAISAVGGTGGAQIAINNFDASNQIYLQLGSLPSTTGPFLASISSIQVFSSTDSLDTNGYAAFSGGSASAYAAPYFASALSILPVLTSLKRIKRRVLSA